MHHPTVSPSPDGMEAAVFCHICNRTLLRTGTLEEAAEAARQHKNETRP